MTAQDPPPGWSQRLHEEWRHLSRIQTSDRRWELPLAAALSNGLPLFIGAWFGHLEYGLISSLGGLVLLYTPHTPMSHRMVWLMACAFAMTSCYALGVMSHFHPGLIVPALMFITALVTMGCRFYSVGPPGSMFFVMAASIGAFTPVTVEEVPRHVGLLAMGVLLAWLIAFFYSLVALRRRPPLPVPSLAPATFDTVVFDSVFIGVFVGLSLLLAQLLGMERAYWVPISCVAVMQGTTLRAVWIRQTHRIVGTAGGLLLAWALLSLPSTPWTLSAIMTGLAFVIEWVVVRHYGLAMVFITPMSLLLAEAASLGHSPPSGLIEARMLDTVVGSLAGLLGGAALHSPRFRAALSPWLRRAVPERLLR